MAYGTFTNCIGGDNSFGYYCDGTFTNCIGGEFAFGGVDGMILSNGTLNNCIGGTNSFAPTGDIWSNSILDNCVGGTNSFASSGTIEGRLIKCRLTDGSFSTGSILHPGSLILCINSDNSITTHNP